MKRSNLLLAAAGIVFLVLLASCASSSKSAMVLYSPGVYDGFGDGYQGQIHLRVTVNSQAIVLIEVVEHQETPGFWSEAIEELAVTVLDANSTDVDGVSGASVSSRGFLAAVEDALSRARHED